MIYMRLSICQLFCSLLSKRSLVSTEVVKFDTHTHPPDVLLMELHANTHIFIVLSVSPSGMHLKKIISHS